MNVSTDDRVADLANDLKHDLIDELTFRAKVMALGYSSSEVFQALDLVDGDADV